MGIFNSKPMGYSRRQLLGLDIIEIQTAEAFEKVKASGQLGRLGTVHPFSNLPWLFRLFLPHNQLYNSGKDTWSIPMRPASSSSYPPCLAYLNTAYNGPEASSVDVSAYVTEAVDILFSKKDSSTDNRMRSVCARAMWAYIAHGKHCPHNFEVPEDVIGAASSQLNSPKELINPFKLFRARTIDKVYDFCNAFISATDPKTKTGESLPKELESDLAHAIFIMTRNATALLNEIYKYPNKDVSELFRDLGLSDTALRVAKESGTLGGLLPENNRATKDSTIITINLADIAKETGNSDYAFMVDVGRPCTAKLAILEFAKAVQEEIKKRK